MRFIFECNPHLGIWVVWPSMLFFCRGADKEAGNCIDITISWLCCGLTLRID